MGAEDSGALWIERLKWPDRPHYRHRGWRAGRDEHGTWIELRRGTPWFRGDKLLFNAPGDGLILVPDVDPYLIWFPGWGEHELYVDIVLEVHQSVNTVRAVDLDLDVARGRDGTIRLLDEDEFETHQRQLSYSNEMIGHARRASVRALRAVRENEEPFAGLAAARWLERVRQDRR